MFYVYILKCSDNTLYTGYSNDLNKRVQTHNDGLGAKYTRGRLPVSLLYNEAFDSKSEAMKREYAIKQLSKKSKLRLIKYGRDDLMKVKTHNLFSQELKRETKFKSYGDSGKVMLFFPTSKGRYYDFEYNKMLDSVKDYINNGLLTVYALDSIDEETWFDDKKTIYEKVELNEAYTSYIINEIVPYIKDKNKTNEKMIVSGISIGGFMSANLYFKNPSVFDSIISLSGIYDIRDILGPDIEGSSVYFSSPVDFLSVINNPNLLNDLSQGNIMLADSKEFSDDKTKESLKNMDAVLKRKNILANIDYWQSKNLKCHDLWKVQLQYYLAKLVKKGLI